MTDERQRPGTPADRKRVHADTPRWAWWAIALLVGCFIAAWASTCAYVKSDNAIDRVAKVATSTRALARDNERTIEAVARVQRQADSEATERRDQSCRLFEGQHLADVKALRRSYRFLTGPDRDSLGPQIRQVAIAQLGRLEREARHDKAPKYCDAPNVGLPEPDPVVPRRPAELR